METGVLLHNIRSAHNVGSIFRTADGAGVSRMFISGYTALPVDEKGKTHKDIAKTALGAEKSMPWEYEKSPLMIIERLKRDGWQIAGVELDERAIDYRTFKLEKPTLFIFGNEVEGVPDEMREQCDVLLEIPMRGMKESLNVSVAAGVILFSALR